jgi:hypothetical protein
VAGFSPCDFFALLAWEQAVFRSLCGMEAAHPNLSQFSNYIPEPIKTLQNANLSLTTLHYAKYLEV